MRNDYNNSMVKFDPTQLNNKFYAEQLKNKFYEDGFNAGMNGQMYNPSMTWSKADKLIYKRGFEDARRKKTQANQRSLC